MHQAREALRLIERQREQQLGLARSAGVSMMAIPGKATLTGALAGTAMLDSVSQLARTLAGATSDVAALEQANRKGDLKCALWARGCILRFIKQLPLLLASVPSRSAAELEAQAQVVLARAEAALENAPKISQAARDAADRGDFSLWRADLAPWYAKAQSVAHADAPTQRKPMARDATAAAATPVPVANGANTRAPSVAQAPAVDGAHTPAPSVARASVVDGAPTVASAVAQAPVVDDASIVPPAVAQASVVDGSSAAANASVAAAPVAGSVPANLSAPTFGGDDDEHEIAARGVADAGDSLPYLNAIQQSFGHHDVSSIRAHIGGRAAAASQALGAHAYAYGNAIAFASRPDLHTAAHEAAHIVQQRRGMPRSLGGDDSYERHADLVADRVVRGLPVAALLDAGPRGGGTRTAIVQRKKTSGEPSHARSAPELSPKPGAEKPPELEQKPGMRWPVYSETGLPYIIQSKGGLPGFWAIRSWVAAKSGATDVTKAMHAPTCAREVLAAMGWVSSKNLEYAANQLTFTFFEERTYFQVGAIAAHATGLPPGRQALVERGIEGNKHGLTVTVVLDDIATAPGQSHVMTTSEMQRTLQAAADFTSIPFDPEGHAFVMTHWAQNVETGSGVLTAILDRAFCAKLFGPAAYNKWLGDKNHHTHDLKTPKLKLENFYKSPIPGRLTHHGDVVEHDEAIRLEVVVDWPSYYPNSEIYDVPPMVTPSKSGTVALLQCQWTFERLDGRSDGPSPKGSVQTLSTSLAEATHRFCLAPGEKSGLFSATCSARADAYFEPTTIPPRQIVVLSAAEAMAQQQSKAFADLGADNADRKNERWTGDVRPGFRASPAAGSPEDIADPSAHDRATKREQLRAVATYLGDNPANAEAVAALNREAARQDDSEKLLADDRAKGWQSFQVRGTYLSRTEGVPTGPLDLHGTVHMQFHQDAYAGDGPSTTAYMRDDKVRVQIRDLSRRFKQVDFEFVGEGDTFDDALQRAFYDLAITYPKGNVSIEAEQIRHGALRQVDGAPGAEAAQGATTGKVIGFQRSTETTWKTVKGVVWDPIASVSINLGAIALMVLVPGSAAVVAPMLIVYNSVPSVDHIKTKADSGTLTAQDVVMSTGEIALNLLPALSRARRLSAGWFAVEAANWGGRIALMGGSAFEMARELQATHVAALAQEYQQFLELQKTSLPSDPGLAAAEAHIRKKAAEVDGEIARQFTEQVKSNAIQIVVIGAASSVVHQTSTRARTAILERLAKRAAEPSSDSAPASTDGPAIAGGSEAASPGSASNAAAPDATMGGDYEPAAQKSANNRTAADREVKRSIPDAAGESGHESAIGDKALYVGRDHVAGYLRAAQNNGAKIRELSRDANGARRFEIEHADGRRDTVVANSANKKQAVTPKQAARNRAAADEAARIQYQRDEQLRQLIENRGDKPILLDTAIVGAGQGGTWAFANRTEAGAAIPGVAVSDIPKVINIAPDGTMFAHHGDFPIGQKPGDLHGPAASRNPSEFTSDADQYTRASDFTRAVVQTGYDAGMVTYRATVTEVEVRPPNGWGLGADVDTMPLRLTAGGHRMYAKQVIMSTGLGTPRPIGKPGTSLAANEPALRAAGLLVNAEHSLTLPGGKKTVLVVGDGATGAWACEAAIKAGAERIYWAGKYDANSKAAVDPVVRASLEQLGLSDVEIATYTRAYNDRNSAVFAHIQNGNIVLAPHGLTDAKLDSKTGRVAVTLKGHNGPLTVDGIVAATGQKVIVPKGIDRKSMEFRMVLAEHKGKPRLVALDAFGSDGKPLGIRIQGAQMVKADSLVAHDQIDRFRQLIKDQSVDVFVPRDAQGVPGSIVQTNVDAPLAGRKPIQSGDL